MAGENDDFGLDGLFEDAPEPPVTVVEGTPKEVQDDSAGKTQEEAPPENSQDAGEPEQSGQTVMVPKAALDEARQRARDAEERLAKQGKTEETTDQPERAGIRDPKEDPEGFAEDILGTIQLNTVNVTLNTSERFARKEHGNEVVDKVRDWALAKFETDPSFATKVLTDPDPYEVAIKAYNDEQLSAVTSKIDPEILKGLDEEEIALLRKHRAEKSGGGQNAGGSTAETNQPRGDDGKFAAPRRKVDAPPGSIISEPSGGKSAGEPAVGEGVAFLDAFG